MRTARLLLSFVPVVLAGCATHEERAAPAQRRIESRARPRPAPPVAMSNAAYVRSAAAIDLFEIRSSELALQRSATRRVRDFAAMMIKDHKGTSSQLSLAGRRLNLLPSARLDAPHQAMLDALRQSANFDAAYKRQQLTVHQEAEALHSRYAASGTSPTLRPVAAANLPVVRRHLRLLRYL
ncbi:MAG TPA: DUF4142 domain-containing protein [Sphingomicrobium sp.]|jgi:putative membrane protein|nr:DUF4142 domain-containing protein [Sphingomicrobium sp.]